MEEKKGEEGEKKNKVHAQPAVGSVHLVESDMGNLVVPARRGWKGGELVKKMGSVRREVDRLLNIFDVKSQIKGRCRLIERVYFRSFLFVLMLDVYKKYCLEDPHAPKNEESMARLLVEAFRRECPEEYDEFQEECVLHPPCEHKDGCLRAIFRVLASGENRDVLERLKKH